MVVKSTQSRGGVKGGSPLQGQGTASLVGLGATPQLLHRSTYSKRKVKHGTLVAGSEASLRSNSRSRRSGIPQQHKKSTMKMCIRSNPEGDRRLRLFSLPSGRLRRGETLCSTKINLLKAPPHNHSSPSGQTNSSSQIVCSTICSCVPEMVLQPQSTQVYIVVYKDVLFVHL